MAIESEDLQQVRALWDSVLDMLFVRMGYRSISIAELKHLKTEVRALLLASRGVGSAWKSVIDTALLLMEADSTVRRIETELPYSESTIYRALTRLADAGFAESFPCNEMGRSWSINREKCPILYLATRTSEGNQIHLHDWSQDSKIPGLEPRTEIRRASPSS